MTAWRWDELYGSIQAGRGDRRIALLPACVIGAFARLEGVEEPSRTAVVEEAIYLTTVRSLQDGADDAYGGGDLPPDAGGNQAMIERMGARGWGEVISSRCDGGDWRIEVADPVDDAIIAGWLRAIYTHAMGREPRLEVGGEPPARRFDLA
jgi:hypothetical protein